MTTDKWRRFKLIDDRLRELGLPQDHVLQSGELSYLFFECGNVMVSRDGHKNSALYPPERKWLDVLSDFGEW